MGVKVILVPCFAVLGGIVSGSISSLLMFNLVMQC